MKRFTFLVAIALVFFYGCNKEKTELTPNDQQVVKSGSTGYIVSFDENGAHVQQTVKISKEDLQNYTPSPTASRSNSNHANGHFSYVNDVGDVEGTITFSAVQNNGGIHGQVVVNGLVSFHGETNCLMVDGNKAVFGCVITQVSDNAGLDFITPGNYVYFRVDDNGEGENDPSDQYCNIFNVTEDDWCELGLLDVDYVYIPASILWADFGFSDTANESDQIQVND